MIHLSFAPLKFGSFLLLFLAIAQLGQAQDNRAVLERALQRYTEMENLSFEMYATAFSEEEAREGAVVFRGVFKKRGESFYTSAWNREMIVNEREMLVVNHEQQKMARGRSQPEVMGDLTYPTSTIDSILISGAQLESLGQKNGERHYRLNASGGVVAQIEFYLGAHDLITRMVYHYRDTPLAHPAYARLELQYRNISFAKPDAAFFDEAKFVSPSAGGELRPSAPYRDYELRELTYDTFSSAPF